MQGQARIFMFERGGLGELVGETRACITQIGCGTIPVHPARLLRRQGSGEPRVSWGQIFVTFSCQVPWSDKTEMTGAAVWREIQVGGFRLDEYVARRIEKGTFTCCWRRVEIGMRRFIYTYPIFLSYRLSCMTI